MSLLDATDAHRQAVNALPDLGLMVVRDHEDQTRSFSFAAYTAWKRTPAGQRPHKITSIHCAPPDGDGAVVYQLGSAVATPAPSEGPRPTFPLQSDGSRPVEDGAGIGAAEPSIDGRPPLRPLPVTGLHGPS